MTTPGDWNRQIGKNMKTHHFLHHLAAILRGALLALLLTTVLALIYASTAGLPEWLLSDVLRRLDAGAYHWEMKGIRLDALRGFVMDDVRLYRKKVLGPPAVEAKEMIARLSLVAFARGEFPLKELKIINADIRPSLAGGTGEPSRNASEFSASFQIAADNCRMLGVDFESFSCGISHHHSVTRVENIQAALANRDTRGSLTGKADYDSKTKLLNVSLTTALDPHILLPMIRAWDAPFTEELVRRFSFSKTPPRCDLHFTQLCDTNWSFSLDGQFWIQNSSYMDVDVLRADGTISLSFSDTNSLVVIDPLLVVRNDGTASAGFTVDNVRSNVQFDGTASISPSAILRMAGVFTNDELSVFRFNGPLKMKFKGVADYADMSGTDFSGTVDARDLGIGSFDIEKCAFTMSMLGLTNSVSNITGTAYGGELAGSATFVASPGTNTDLSYSVKATVANADFARIAGIAGPGHEDFKGRISGDISIAGLLGTGKGRTAKGSGYVRIKEGRVFMLPVFGGLSHIMTSIIPGLDFVLRQTDATAAFTIASGLIHTDEAHIEGDILSLTGSGNYHFLDGGMDFEVRLTLLKSKTFVAKIMGYVMYPISKLFEFRLRGTYDKPSWYPVNFSTDLLQKLHLTSEKNGSQQ
jgi:hypothetical protein